MYKCAECGHLFEEGEENNWNEYAGECHGAPSYEGFSGCPICRGEYDEVQPCEDCGSYENIDNGMRFCNECKEAVKTRVEDFIKKEFSKKERETLAEYLDEFYLDF